MPRFVAKGPDLPVELLKAQAADELVIFAGAGVSRPELPGFGGLVKQLYEELGEVMEGAEERLFEREDFDRVLYSLEITRRVTGMRTTVRSLLQDLPEGFEPKTHRALLDIARADGTLRLVTTNFDRLFLEAEPGLEEDQARLSIGPRLPTPRRTHWEGLVHLHGLIHQHDPGGRNLVLTSGDFGRAYLVDGWASRFVTELFRNFHVLFVGYSVNDPVLRYLLSALAVERTDGGSFKDAFALAGIQGDKEQKEQKEDWKAKGVEPLFYTHHGADHSALAETLEEWAELSRGGLKLRQSLALREMDDPPSDPEDDQARLTVWALSEESGSVARSFADRDPVPPVEWLQIFEKCSELPDDQKLLALPEKEEPPPSPLVSWPSQAAFPFPLSAVTRHLARWLVKHLNTSEAVEWVLSHGAVLHPRFRWQIRSELQEGLELTAQRRKFWGVVASETYTHLKTQQRIASRFGYWLRGQPISNWLQWSEVVTLLRPVPRLSSRNSLRAEAAKLWGKTPTLPSPNGQEDYFHVELELLGGSTALVILRHLIDDSKPPNHRLADSEATGLIDDAPRLLHEALLWQSHFDDRPPESQSTYAQMPSISRHPQNRHRSKWTLLIALNRVAFEWLNNSDPPRVQSLIDTWLSFDFLVFRRLALHAVTEGTGVDADLGIEILLANDALLLWDPEGRREGLRFLRKAADRTSAGARRRLMKAILDGPSMVEASGEELSPEAKIYKERKQWLRLSRLKTAEVDLPKDALKILALGEERGWSVASDHSDELAFEHVEAQRLVVGDEPDLREWVGEHPKLIVCKLGREARSDVWDSQKWRSALQEFGTPTYEAPSDRRRLAVVLRWLEQMPEAELEFLLHQISWWLQEQARKIPQACEQSLLTVIGRVSDIALQQEAYVDQGNVIDQALNHPAGHLAQALLQRTWSRRPEADAGIPNPLEPLLRKLAEAQTKASRLSRAILVTDLGSLFLLDRAWTKEVLLPHLRATAPDASSMWQAFLSHPRWEPVLIADLKTDFLAAFDHIEDLEPHRENACRFLVFTSIHYPAAISKKELEKVLREMAPDDLAFVAGALETVLSDSDQPATVWRETVEPWIETHWPVRENARSAKVVHGLALAILETGAAFPQAVNSMSSRLTPIEGRNSQRVDWLMEQKGLARDFPEKSLDLLDQLVPAEPTQSWPHLEDILEVVKKQRPDLASVGRWRRLCEVIERNPYWGNPYW